MLAGRKRTGWSTVAQEIVDRLFVYGTLLQGHAARSLVATYIVAASPATTQGRIVAFPEGYPGLIDDSASMVVGELVQLVDLAAAFALLDAYEGDEFMRVLKKVALPDGAERWAWCYVLRDPAQARRGQLIESGNWNEYRRTL